MHKLGKFSLLLIITALLVLLSTGTVFAGPKGTVKGEVLAIDTEAGEFTVETRAGEVTVSASEELIESIDIGMTVLVKGQWNEGVFEAEWVKQVGPGEDSEGAKNADKEFRNAFCTGDREHPLAAKISEKYKDTEVTAEQIQTWFCEGHSFGQIMLALTTSLLDENSDPGDVLSDRKKGNSWGKIWKDRELIGAEHQGMPPGWAKKPDKGDQGGPPGWQKENDSP